MKTFWHHIWFRPVGHVSKTCRPALEHLAVAGVQLVLLVLPPPPLPHPAGHLLLQVGEHPGHQPVELFVETTVSDFLSAGTTVSEDNCQWGQLSEETVRAFLALGQL